MPLTHCHAGANHFGQPFSLQAALADSLRPSASGLRPPAVGYYKRWTGRFYLKRQVPGNIPEDDFNERINFLRNFLGEKWISKSTNYNSPLKLLWNRRDFLASTELYIIASAVQKFLGNGKEQEWLDGYKTFLKSPKASEVVSQTYELVSASIFQTDGQAVELCGSCFPGYDFGIHLKKRHLRVSCKKLQPSDNEIRFRALSSATYSKILKHLQANRVTGVRILVQRDGGGLFDGSVLEKHTLKALDAFLQQKRAVLVNSGGYILSVAPMSAEIPGWRFGHQDVSIQFNCIVPIEREEQKRFEDLFRRAATNFKKNVQLPDSRSVNVVMIGLPSSISMSLAETWLNGQFTTSFSSISAVILTRYIPTNSADNSKTMTGFEFKVIPNQRATQIWPDGSKEDRIVGRLEIGVPIGVESKQVMIIDSKSIDMTNYFNFQRGQIYHEHMSGPVKYMFNSIPGVRIFSVIKPDPDQESITLEAIRPPSDDFVIL